MSDYSNVGRAAALFWIVVGLLLFAIAVFFIGRCTTKYSVRVEVKPKETAVVGKTVGSDAAN